MKYQILTALICLLAVSNIPAQDQLNQIPGTNPFARATTIKSQNPSSITLTRLHYGGGGDWYEGNSAAPNLLIFIAEQTGWPVDLEEKQVRIEDDDLFSYPFLFATGHGVIIFTENEMTRLRQYLLTGGFLLINDSYGMDKSVRTAAADLFPGNPLQEIPFDHPIYHSFFDFPNGPPKIHEHDNKPASGRGIVIDGRIVFFYLFESDIVDGWEDEHVHNDPPEKRLEALKMGLNIVAYAMAY
ncbi:MAG: DUF4159 domain-containing protein [candidate division Zixibacteria bacterium]